MFNKFKIFSSNSTALKLPLVLSIVIHASIITGGVFYSKQNFTPPKPILNQNFDNIIELTVVDESEIIRPQESPENNEITEIKEIPATNSNKIDLISDSAKLLREHISEHLNGEIKHRAEEDLKLIKKQEIKKVETKTVETALLKQKDFPKNIADTTQSNDLKSSITSQNKVESFVHAQPNYSYNPPPKYPESARRLKQQGTVLLKVDVDSEGKVLKIEIKESSHCEILDSTAVSTVSSWSFIPAKLNGASIPSQVEVPIKFQLK